MEVDPTDRAEERRRVEVDRAKVDMAREEKEKLTVGGQGGGEEEEREQSQGIGLRGARSTGGFHTRLGKREEKIFLFF